MSRIAVLLTVAAAFAHLGRADELPAIKFRDASGSIVTGYRCGVPNPGAEAVAAAEAAFLASETAKSGDCVGTAREVPLAFHIITSGATGNVTDAQIANQVRVLNAAFLGSGISFVVVDVERVSSATWFSGCITTSELAMKQNLAYDPTELINLYTCKPASNVLGVATFPWLFPENHYQHGVTLHYGTFPGGSASGYNQGDTAVHEIGHYFGLYHTFQGGCAGQGDFVVDTPAEAKAASGCQPTRNTCASVGFDPVANFMDYSVDTCLVNFSLGQVGRMHAALSTFRPSLP